MPNALPPLVERFPRFRAAAISGVAAALFAIPAPAFAIDNRDPEIRALEAKNTAIQLRQEASHLEEKAKAGGTPVDSELKKYIELTNKEAEWLEKAAKAWENNQRNLAPKHMERAMELCEKRGPMAAKIHARLRAKELLTEKNKERAGECHKPAQSEAHKKSGEHEKTQLHEKAGETSADHQKPAEKPAAEEGSPKTGKVIQVGD